MHALTNAYDLNYQPLADLTWNKNKIQYAQHHGYAAFAKTSNFVDGVSFGYQKIYQIRDIMDHHPEIDWIWYTGTDSMVTNMSTRIEDKIDNRYHFMISVDFNSVNADSFLIRNTPEGRSIIDYLISVAPEACKEWDSEQRAINWALGTPTFNNAWPNIPYYPVSKKFKDIARIYPQNYMNSYNYELYYDRYIPREQGDYDVFGYRGNWVKGDWLIHWPGTTLEERMQLAKQYAGKIVL